MIPGTTDNPSHGPTRHVYEISKRLGKKGFTVLNLLPCNNAQPTVETIDGSYYLVRIREFDFRLVQRALKKIDFHLGLIPHYASHREAVRRFLDVRDRKVILHTHGLGVINQPRKENRLCSRLVTIHGFGQLDTLARGHAHFKVTLLHSILRNLYQHGDQYTTFSKTMQTMTNRLYGLSPERVTIVPHGVDSGFFSKKVTPAEMEDSEAKFQLDRPFKVLFLGHMTKGKGLDIVLKALKILKQHRSDIMLILKVGLKKDYLEMVRESERLGIKDHVRVLFGHFSETDLRALYKVSDVFVNYQLQSGHSTALLEAMASGVPPVIYKHSMNTDIVDRACGILLETLEAEELAGALEVLADDHNLAMDLGRKAMRKMQEDYDWDQAVVPKYASVYRNLER
jgi:glycosyltransferase involved in cell wall biosynthesis